MRTLHIIIGAALTAAFVIGCSKSSTETPTIRLAGYIDAAGNHVAKGSQASFEVKNPSDSWIICAFHNPATGPHDAVFTIQPNSTQNVGLFVGQTNLEAMSVTVKQVRVVSSRDLSVPMPRLPWLCLSSGR